MICHGIPDDTELRDELVSELLELLLVDVSEEVCDERLELVLELRLDDDVFTLLLELLSLLLDVLDVIAEQSAPCTCGISIAPLLVAPCKPNSTDCPGWMLLFQLRLVAV